MAGDEGDGEADEEDPLASFDEELEPAESGDADPFERLGDGPTREGDPFARLGEDDAERDRSGADEEAPGPGWADADAEREPDGAEDEADDPFAAFGDAAGDPFEGEQDPFADVESSDSVWERMDAAADLEAEPEEDTVDVSKHSYCERCEYFSAPPAVSCSHEGTEIVEFTDMEMVRVRDCPVVAERRAIEDET